MDRPPEATEITCSLSDREFRERRALVRAALQPHVLKTERLVDGLRLIFASGETTRDRVEGFVDLERQCCGFLSFALTQDEDALILTITGPRDAGTLLDAFASWTSPVDRPKD